MRYIARPPGVDRTGRRRTARRSGRPVEVAAGQPDPGDVQLTGDAVAGPGAARRRARRRGCSRSACRRSGVALSSVPRAEGVDRVLGGPVEVVADTCRRCRATGSTPSRTRPRRRAAPAAAGAGPDRVEQTLLEQMLGVGRGHVDDVDPCACRSRPPAPRRPGAAPRRRCAPRGPRRATAAPPTTCRRRTTRCGRCAAAGRRPRRSTGSKIASRWLSCMLVRPRYGVTTPLGLPGRAGRVDDVRRMVEAPGGSGREAAEFRVGQRRRTRPARASVAGRRRHERVDRRRRRACPRPSDVVTQAPPGVRRRASPRSRSAGWSSSSGRYAAPVRSTANSATTISIERGSASATIRSGPGAVRRAGAGPSG